MLRLLILCLIFLGTETIATVNISNVRDNDANGTSVITVTFEVGKLTKSKIDELIKKVGQAKHKRVIIQLEDNGFSNYLSGGTTLSVSSAGVAIPGSTNFPTLSGSFESYLEMIIRGTIANHPSKTIEFDYTRLPAPTHVGIRTQEHSIREQQNSQASKKLEEEYQLLKAFSSLGLNDNKQGCKPGYYAFRVMDKAGIPMEGYMYLYVHSDDTDAKTFLFEHIGNYWLACVEKTLIDKLSMIAIHPHGTNVKGINGMGKDRVFHALNSNDGSITFQWKNNEPPYQMWLFDE